MEKWKEVLKNRTTGKSLISVSQEHSRAALHTEGTHSIHAHFTHVHALVGDLDHAALKVLLIIHIHLREKKKGEENHFSFVCYAAIN